MFNVCSLLFVRFRYPEDDTQLHVAAAGKMFGMLGTGAWQEMREEGCMRE